MVRKKLGLLTAALLSAALLWGCGSSGSGGMDVQPSDGVERVGEHGDNSFCLTCHGAVHSIEFSPLIGQAAPNAHSITHDCQDCHGAENAPHTGRDRLPGLARCADCHEGEVETVATNHVDNCAACHNPVTMTMRSFDDVNACRKCHTTLDAEKIADRPFSDEIYERFVQSRHATGSRRDSLPTANQAIRPCAACHSHEGALLYFAAIEESGDRSMMLRGGVNSLVAELEALGPDSGLSFKNCYTCHAGHSPEKRNLRGFGDIVETIGGAATPTGPAERVVYSAEFNLCTACHQVNLVHEWNPEAGYNGGGMFEYRLADAHAVLDRLDEVDLHNADSTNAARTIVDTHFAGVARIAAGGASPGAPQNIVGYNVNPGSTNACTSCHDPHSASKFGAGTGASFTQAVQYAQSIGQNHGNYLSNAFSRQNITSNSCVPCHTGREFPQMTKGKFSTELGSVSWNSLGCVSCHDMLNTQAAANNPTVANNLPRTFPEDYVFAFNSGVVVDAAELGENQVCFECHKGRSATVTDANRLNVRQNNYLHYKAIFATLFGADSEMLILYRDQADYNGRFTHPDVGTGVISGAVGCVDCHEVHSGRSLIVDAGANCVTCHGPDSVIQTLRVGNLQARVDTFANRLLDTILAVIQTQHAAFAATNGITDRDTLKTRIKGSSADTSSFPTAALASAGATWKNLMYHDKAVWAHNSRFARQLLYDAIVDLGGDTTGLTRP